MSEGLGTGAVGLVQGGLCKGVGSWPKCGGPVRLVAWDGQQQRAETQGDIQGCVGDVRDV